MTAVLLAILGTLRGLLRSRAALHTELLALRHQVQVLRRRQGARRPGLGALDRILWASLSRIWSGWRQAVVIVKPETVLRWHRQGFRLFWRWKSRRKRPGRPPVAPEIRRLIAEMRRANPTWGAPRIHGELLKLGFEISQTGVSNYLPRRPRPPSQGWWTFVRNHLFEAVAIDFAVVPTATFRLLHVVVVLSLERRRVLQINVTAHPTAEWTARQVLEAFPWEASARYLIRDRDGVYAEPFRRTVRILGLREVLIGYRAPWQNGHVERFIGSLRRECLDHVVALGEGHLRRVVTAYAAYHNRTRTHLSLEKDAPFPRSVQGPGSGRVVAVPEVGGLHHRYERRAA